MEVRAELTKCIEAHIADHSMVVVRIALVQSLEDFLVLCDNMKNFGLNQHILQQAGAHQIVSNER
jgi:hypothetical protein